MLCASANHCEIRGARQALLLLTLQQYHCAHHPPYPLTEGYIHCCSHECLLPGRKRLACRIINTGSMHALVASPYKSAYNAAKHGIAGLTKTVGLELAQKGNITCNAICPG